MAVVVIFGLMVATFLTLLVVPTLYTLFTGMAEKGQSAAQWLRHIYWKPYRWLAGEKIHGYKK
jgi:type II secretory pathway component PulF